MRSKRPYQLVLLLVAAAVVLSVGLAAPAGALPTFTQGVGSVPACETCHSMSQVHGVTAHAALMSNCGVCHTSGTATPPPPSACGGCHGGVAQIIIAPTHSTTGCSTTPGCHGVPEGGAVITSITPAQALAGGTVTIAGTGFGATQGTGMVTFGTTAAAITSWSDTSIVVTVPESLIAGAVNVSVTPAGGTASAAFPFTVQESGADTTPPVTSVSGAVNNRWYNHSLTIRLTAVDTGSGVASITYSVDGGTEVVVAAASATIDLTVDRTGHTTDGRHVITYFATDLADNVEATRTLVVNIDTRHPRTKALANASIHRFGYVYLRYRVTDQQPNAGKAKVVIQVRRGSKTVATLRLGTQPVNRALKARLHATMSAGTYRYYVRATDTAGNVQANVASARLIVRSGFSGGSW